jgi:Mg/Co/Ni transporter MgtE
MLDQDDKAEARFLSNEDRAAAIRARQYLADLVAGDMIADYWHTDDVHEALSQMSEEDAELVPETFSNDRARKVLAAMEENHDAQYGYNWDSLESELRNELEGKA